MIDYGDPVSLQVQIRDADGALANADSVVCTVTLPDGTTATPDVSNDETGVYSIAYQPTQAGHHRVDWVATGTNACALTDSFNVSASTDTALISLADAKRALNFTGTGQDEELRDYIAAATDDIERLIGPVIPRSVTEVVTSRGGYLRLATCPVIEVTAISSLTGSGVTYDVDDFVVSSPLAGLVTLPTSTIVPDVYEVTYSAGRTGVIPPRWLQACRLLVQHLWATQRGSSSPGRRRGEALDEYQAGTAYTVPNRVLELLQLDLTGPLVG